MISRSLFLGMINISKLHTKSKHAFMLHKFVFDIRAVYKICGIMWRSQRGHRWQYGVCALHAGCLRLQTHTHIRICNTYCFSTATMVARTRLNATLYVYRLLFYLSWTFRDVTPHSWVNRIRGLSPSFTLLTLGTNQAPSLKTLSTIENKDTKNCVRLLALG
jgi:hypothetical protein